MLEILNKIITTTKDQILQPGSFGRQPFSARSPKAGVFTRSRKKLKLNWKCNNFSGRFVSRNWFTNLLNWDENFEKWTTGFMKKIRKEVKHGWRGRKQQLFLRLLRDRDFYKPLQYWARVIGEAGKCLCCEFLKKINQKAEMTTDNFLKHEIFTISFFLQFLNVWSF